MVKILLLFALIAPMAVAGPLSAESDIGTESRTDALDEQSWKTSEWISVAAAPVVTESDRKRKRAADGTSCFRFRHVNAKDVKCAKWMTSGLGVYELYLNGGRSIGTDFLKPGFTHVRKTRRSFTYDITSRLRRGKGESNDFGVEVGTGWWCDRIALYAGRKPAFRGVIEFVYEDGTSERVGTKASEWFGEVSGPVRHSGIFDGEEYDARETNCARTPHGDFTPGGCEPDDQFRGEILPTDGAEVCLRLDLTRKRGMARRHFAVKPGEPLVVDFGQNCAAVPFFEFRARRGTVLTVLPGEMLNDADRGRRGCDGAKGSVYRANLRMPENGMRAVYTFSGEGWERYLPRFTFFGYRYLSIVATDEVEIRTVASVPVTSVTEAMETGHLETGVADVNSFISNVYWGHISNYLSVPTDCPQRDERLGWMADTQVFAEAGAFNADTLKFFRKWSRDMRDSVDDEGGYSSIAPWKESGNDHWKFGWADAGVIVPWTVWRMFGDRTILEENFATMARFVRKLDDTRYDFESRIDYNYADWLSYEKYETCGNSFGSWKDWKNDRNAMNYRRYLAACYWLHDARLMVEMSRALGRTRDADWFAGSAERALSHIRNRFLEADGLLLRPMRGLQTACVFALHFGIVEGGARSETLGILKRNIHEHGDCLQTGFLGTSFLLDALSECGETDLCYTLLLQHKNPSWLYSVDQGATTVWERWNSYTKEGGFGPVGMNSFNHYAYGQVLGWMYRNIAGIAADSSAPGFRNIIMAPKPDRRLGSAKAEYRSRAGRIVSAWRYEGEKWVWDFTIPEGATATVTLPGETASRPYGAGEHHVVVPCRNADWVPDAAQTQEIRWKIAPIYGGGYFQNVIICPSATNVWYSYVDVGGPYRSDDAGETWRPLHCNFTMPARLEFADHVRTMSVDPRDENSIVLCCGNDAKNPAGIYVSRDGGRNFRKRLTARFYGNGRTRMHGLVLHRSPYNPDELVAASDADGIFRSRDNGETWENAGATGVKYTDIRYDLAVRGRVYACGPKHDGRKNGFWRSDDGGETWRCLSSETPTELVQIDGRDEIVGLNNGSVARSADGGMTWEPYGEGLEAFKKGVNWCNNPGVYYAAAGGPDFYVIGSAYGSLWKRTLGEKAWTKVPRGKMEIRKEEGFLAYATQKGRMDSLNTIVIDKNDPRHWLATDFYFIWESNDAGCNWRSRIRGIMPLVSLDVAFDPFDSKRVCYGCADMRMLCTWSGGDWYFAPGDRPCGNSISFSRRTPHLVFAVGGQWDPLRFGYSEDGGSNWKFPLTNDSGLPPIADTEVRCVQRGGGSNQ